VRRKTNTPVEDAPRNTDAPKHVSSHVTVGTWYVGNRPYSTGADKRRRSEAETLRNYMEITARLRN